MKLSRQFVFYDDEGRVVFDAEIDKGTLMVALQDSDEPIELRTTKLTSVNQKLIQALLEDNGNKTGWLR